MTIKVYAIKEIEIDENEPIIKKYIDNNYNFDDLCNYAVLDEYFKNKTKVNNTCMDKAPNAEDWILVRADEKVPYGTEDFITWE